jgi:putative aldouronate transport system permease protein
MAFSNGAGPGAGPAPSFGARERRRARRAITLRNTLPVYVLALPAFLYFAIFTYYPTVLGFLVSFQTYRLVGKSDWVGLANYAKVIHTYGFWNVAWNTLVLGLANMVVGTLVVILIALLLNEILRSFWKKVIQTAIFIPHLFGWVVVTGIWYYVLAIDRGILNSLLVALGVEPVHFLSAAEWGKPLVVFLGLWKDAGYSCILYLAAIAGINPELYESAVIDGAGRLRQAFSITLPSLVPTIKILAILGITGMFQIFDPIWVLRNNGNNMAIDTIMIYVKQYGIDRMQMGYTSAISVLLFIVILVITLATKQGLRYKI